MEHIPYYNARELAEITRIPEGTWRAVLSDPNGPRIDASRPGNNNPKYRRYVATLDEALEYLKNRQ